MDQKYFTLVRKDVLDSMNQKILFIRVTENCNANCFMCNFAGNKNGHIMSICEMSELIKELEKYDYAHFYNLEECVDKDSYLGLNVSIQPTDEFKNLVDLKYKKYKELER